MLSQLPLLALSCFVVHTTTEALHGTAFSSTYFFVLDIANVSVRGKVGFTDLKYPVVFMVKQLIYILTVVGSDYRSAASVWHFVDPVSVCK